jgi:dTDP-glucose pyrophosphorylase
MRDEYEITSSIQILIDDGYPVYPAEVIEWDMNITVLDDLILSNLMMLDFLHKDSEIGKNVCLHPETKIIHSVVGNDVVVEHPLTIQDSMIMPGTRIIGEDNIHRSLIANDYRHTLGE